MKIALWILGFITLAAGMLLFAGYSSTNTTAYLTPTVIKIDCGRIQCRTRVEKAVPIGNPTAKRLTVKKVVSSCGCVKKAISAEWIDPGAAVELSIAYDARVEPGTFQQRVDVFFEESDVPVTVELLGTIVSWYRHRDNGFVFGEVVTGSSSGERVVNIELEEACSEDEIEIHHSDPGLKIQASIDDRLGKHLSLHAVFSPASGGHYGLISGEVFFQLKGRDDRRLSFAWSATVVSRSDIMPRIANFGILDSSALKRARVQWRQRGEKNYLHAPELRCVHQYGEAIQATFSDHGDGVVEIDMALSRNKLIQSGTIEGIATITTQDGEPVFDVPFIAFVPPHREDPK